MEAANYKSFFLSWYPLIVFDNGLQFNYDKTKVILDLYDYVYVVKIYIPNSNSKVENSNKEIGKYDFFVLKTLLKRMKYYWVLYTSKNGTTKICFKLLHGWRDLQPFELVLILDKNNKIFKTTNF